MAKKVTARFDRIYKAHAPEVPVAYLQALASHESSNNPEERTGIAWGLLQISEPALETYNKAKGTNHELRDVLKPIFNVKVWYLNYKMWNRVFQRIVRDQGIVIASNFVEDWSNPEYALLITAAHNSGIGAVAKGAEFAKGRILEPVRVRPITAADVFKFARRDAVTRIKKKMSKAKQAFQARVVEAYFILVKGEREGLRVPTEVTLDRGGRILLFLIGLWYFTNDGR